MGEELARLDRWRRLDHREPLARQRDRVSRSPMPSTQHCAADEKGHVGAQRQADLEQARSRPSVSAHKRFQRQQRARCIGAAAAHAGHAGNRLSIEMSAPSAVAAGGLQGARGAQAEVVFGQRRAEIVARKPASSRRSKCRLSAQSTS